MLLVCGRRRLEPRKEFLDVLFAVADDGKRSFTPLLFFVQIGMRVDIDEAHCIFAMLFENQPPISSDVDRALMFSISSKFVVVEKWVEWLLYKHTQAISERRAHFLRELIDFLFETARWDGEDHQRRLSSPKWSMRSSTFENAL